MWPGLDGIGKAILGLNDETEPPEYPEPKRDYPTRAARPPEPTKYQLEGELRRVKTKLAAATTRQKRIYEALVSLGVDIEAVNDEITRLEALR